MWMLRRMLLPSDLRFNFVSNSQYYRKNARNGIPGAEDKAIKPSLKERFFLFCLIIL